MEIFLYYACSLYNIFHGFGIKVSRFHGNGKSPETLVYNYYRTEHVGFTQLSHHFAIT